MPSLFVFLSRVTFLVTNASDIATAVATSDDFDTFTRGAFISDTGTAVVLWVARPAATRADPARDRHLPGVASPVVARTEPVAVVPLPRFASTGPYI